jgi:hypothetical protein
MDLLIKHLKEFSHLSSTINNFECAARAEVNQDIAADRSSTTKDNCLASMSRTNHHVSLSE